jgi:hypothetical protein
VTDIARIESRQLLALDPDGRPCEICGGRMHDHTWADLNDAGFAVACSERPGVPAEPTVG